MSDYLTPIAALRRPGTLVTGRTLDEAMRKMQANMVHALGVHVAEFFDPPAEPAWTLAPFDVDLHALRSA